MGHSAYEGALIAGQNAGDIDGSPLAHGDAGACVPMILHSNEGSTYDGLKPPLALDNEQYGSLTVLCAEPGMGKSYIARKLEQMAQREGRATYHYICDDGDSQCISRRIVRRCRDLRDRMNHDKQPLIVFDGVTPGDEFETRSVARALRRLADDGAQVLVCVRPETEQLAEQLPAVDRLGAQQLLFRPTGDLEEDLELTGGIPALVVARRADLAMGEPREALGRHYIDALNQLIGKTVRDGLTREESSIRLTMMLLGHGRLDDISLLAGRCDVEEFYWLQRDAPLFGIDAQERTFNCYGLRSDEVYARCLEGLQSAAAAMPSLVVRTCAALVAQREERRSALTCRLCSSERDFAAVCRSWGVCYVTIGEADLVREGLRAARAEEGPSDVRAVLSEVAMQALLGTSRELDLAARQLEGLKLATSTEQRLYQGAQILIACRDLLRNPRQSSKTLSAEARDTQSLAFLDHMRLVRLLVEGRFGAAYSLASNEMLVREATGVGEALVCDDLTLSLALCGGVPDRRERHLTACAERVFDRSGMRTLKTYHAALASAPDILMSDGVDTTHLEEAANRAEHMGDTFFQGVCLLIEAVADIKAQAATRAHVRSSRCAAIARTMGMEYLASSAELVNALALELLGETGSLASFCDRPGRPDDLALVGRLAAYAAGSGEVAGFAADLPLGTPCPRDALWALNMLASADAAFWRELASHLPPTWIEQLRVTRARRGSIDERPVVVERPAGPSAAMPMETRALEEGTQTELPLAKSRAEGVRVSILGGFSVECFGTKVPSGAFERRRSRDLIMLLALVPGHRLRRYQAMDVLWPQNDYYGGLRRLYEATTEARKRLREQGKGANPILSDRTQGTIGLDASLVSCDVDEFEHEARLALAESGDDFWVLDHASRAERLYGSGPDEHLASLGQMVHDRLSDLRTLYVDAMVAGGEAALRLGKAKLAVRCGSDAHQQAELREDAMILLVRALKAAGRGFEVSDVYKRYSRRLIEAEGVPPSLALRRVVESVLEMDPQGVL